MKNEIVRLKDEIEKTRAELNSKIDSFAGRISVLERMQSEGLISGSTSPSDREPLLKNQIAFLKKLETEYYKKNDRALISAVSMLIDERALELKSLTEVKSPAAVKRAEEPQIKIPLQPAAPVIKKSSALLKIMELVLAPLIGPAVVLIDKLKDMYITYREQGRLAVLFLTGAGIIALVAGIGFILQYSFMNFFTETAKVISGFITALLIVLLGMRIIRRDEGLKEYGSAIIGLGVVINYLCIYFASSKFGLVPAGIGFAMIIANTMFSYVLALKYETRIVAIISYLGGAMSPFFLADVPGAGYYYLMFLLILSVSALYLSAKIKWRILAYVSYVLGAAILQKGILSSGSGDHLVLSVILHIFAYIYIAASMFENRFFRERFGKDDIVIITGSILLLGGNLAALISDMETLGIVFAANALLFVIPASAAMLKISSQMRAALFLIAGVIFAFAVPAYFGVKGIAVTWALETAFLLAAGFLFALPSVRAEAYLLFIVSVTQIVINLPQIYHKWGDIVNSGTGHLAVLGGLLGLCLIIFSRFRDMLNPLDRIARLAADELLSAWMLGVFMVVVMMLLPGYGLLLAMAAMPLLLYRSYRSGLPFTLALGFACYAVVIAQVLISAEAAGTFRFTQQDLPGKIAQAEAFAALWALQLLYEKLMPQSQLISLMKNLRLAFYLALPYIALPHVLHRYPEYFPLALWGSLFANFFLYNIIKSGVLLGELKLMSVIAALSAGVYFISVSEPCFACINGIALSAGLIFFAAVLIIKNGMNKAEFEKSEYSFIFSAGFVYALIFAACIAYMLSASVTVAIYSSVVAALIYTTVSESVPPVKPLRNVYYRGAQVLFLLSVISALESRPSNYAAEFSVQVVSLVMLLAAMKQGASSAAPDKKDFVYDHYVAHAVIFFIYIGLIYRLTGSWAGPFTTVFIVAHSVYVLFYSSLNSMRSLVPLYVAGFAASALKIFFYDLKDFSLFEKIIAFVVIGILMLGAAYLMQKLILSRKQR